MVKISVSTFELTNYIREGEVPPEPHVWVLFAGGILSAMLLNSAFGSKPNGLVIIVVAVVTCLIAYGVYVVMSDTYKSFRNAHRNHLRKRSSIAAGDDLPDSLKAK